MMFDLLSFVSCIVIGIALWIFTSPRDDLIIISLLVTSWHIGKTSK